MEKNLQLSKEVSTLSSTDILSTVMLTEKKKKEKSYREI